MLSIRSDCQRNDYADASIVPPAFELNMLLHSSEMLCFARLIENMRPIPLSQQEIGSQAQLITYMAILPVFKTKFNCKRERERARTRRVLSDNFLTLLLLLLFRLFL